MKPRVDAEGCGTSSPGEKRREGAPVPRPTGGGDPPGGGQPRTGRRPKEAAAGPDSGEHRRTDLGFMLLNVAGRAARQNVLGQALEMSRRPPNFIALLETNSSDWGMEARWADYTRVA